jgi:hypothetical protein
MTLAQNYLATKVRTPYYEIRSICDEYPADSWSRLEPFSEEEMPQLFALREKYGKEEFIYHLDDIFDEDTIHDIIGGDEIIGIDLDYKFYMYSFTYHQITDKGVKTGSIKINLSDETYLKLLALHLGNKNLNINNLKYADKTTYDIVIREIDNCFCYDNIYEVSNPFTVTMDEIKADAQKIREQYPDMFQDEFGIVGYFFY